MTSLTMQRLLRLAAAGLLLAVTGCASVHNPDPLEPMNRRVFSFNEKVDGAVFKPVAQTYANVVPSPARTAVRNVFDNPRDLWSALNQLLQGKPSDAVTSVMRFAVNSTFGLLGLIDIATPAGLEKKREDIGQTLGVWGVPSGAYIVVPLLGPSTVRDGPDVIADRRLAAERLAHDVRVRNSLMAVQAVSVRADLLPVTQMLGDISLDKYIFVRDAYLQRRKSLVYDGNPPDENSLEVVEK